MPLGRRFQLSGRRSWAVGDLWARHAQTPWHAVVLSVFVVVVYPVPTLRPIDMHLKGISGVELGQIACLPIMGALMVGVWSPALER